MLIVLFVAVFLFNGKTEFVTLEAPSAEACVAGGPVLKQKLEARGDVRVAKWTCMAMRADGNAD